MTRIGTMVTVHQDCNKCGMKAFEWRSQPYIFGRYPAGNVLLSFATLMAGASITKILLVFKHMGLKLYHIRSYFRHQNKFIFPSILYYWGKYRMELLNQVKQIKDAVWSGDGRFDSMGHSAKYGAYTMFNCSLMKIGHFELLQVHRNNYCLVNDIKVFIYTMGQNPCQYHDW